MKNLLLLLVLATFAALSAARAEEEAVTVFAAASMKEALETAAAEYGAAGETLPVFSFAASSVLARQIEAGAPADVFISADEARMDWLAERKLIERDSHRAIAGNTLAIVSAPGSAPVADPEQLLAAGRFAMGDPAHVPAGIYAKAALESLGLWDRVKANAVFGENVRVALELVRRGELETAIVYGSDRQAAPELASVFTFPAQSHPPIVYPAARVADGGEGAGKFLDFMSSDAGQRILAAHGFAPAP